MNDNQIKLTVQNRLEIVNMAANGTSYAELGRRFNVSRELIRQICVGVFGRRHRKYDDLTDDDIIDGKNLSYWARRREADKRGIDLDGIFKERYKEKRKREIIEKLKMLPAHGKMKGSLGISCRLYFGSVYAAFSEAGIDPNTQRFRCAASHQGHHIVDEYILEHLTSSPKTTKEMCMTTRFDRGRIWHHLNKLNRTGKIRSTIIKGKGRPYLWELL